MTQKNQTFAFVVGEVSPAFYGRLDLQKYPLGLAEVENFFIDYHGGLVNRSGSEFIAMMDIGDHKLVKFRTKTDDLVLVFTPFQMKVLKNGDFVKTGSPRNALIAGGVVTDTHTLSINSWVWVESGSVDGYFRVTATTVGTFTITSPIGQVVPNGPVSWIPVYELATPGLPEGLETLSVYQDFDTLVCTAYTQLPFFIKRLSDDNWTVTTFSNTLPAAPTTLVGTPSGAGTASVGFVVTAVVNGVESEASTELVTNSIVNYAVVTGHFTLSWAAVAGAERYNVYRSLIYPTTYPAGAQLGYVGYTTGTTFVDRNITADNTKSPPVLADFFAGGNYPTVYTRFQQRGVYAGLVNDPLTVIGSMGSDKERFSLSFPPIAVDSYSYTLDAENDRPIKHILTLRYGLMLFTDDVIVQLRGGDGGSINGLGAVAETQGYVSVSNLKPVAINMDVLFMTALFSEFNQMLYTEYTNSFKMQDILVLSSHLFGPDNPALDVTWAAEPYKLLHFTRADGQRVTLTYERNLEVYGWCRQRTQGRYLSAVAVQEENYNIVYQTVARLVNGVEVIFIEREKPRRDTRYDKMWFVDAGTERKLVRPNNSLTLFRNQDKNEGATWTIKSSTLFSWVAEGQVVYAAGGVFKVVELNAFDATVAVMQLPDLNAMYQRNQVTLPAGTWGYNSVVSFVDKLWWLRGETVSVFSDGDAVYDAVVDETGRLDLIHPAAYVVVGLGYSARAKTLPLSLPNYVLGGFPLSLRSLALRQLRSRGLAVGTSYDTVEEIPSRRYEEWDNPLEMFTELTMVELWGSDGWDLDAQVCFEQKYPLPASIIGFTFDLDIGE